MHTWRELFWFLMWKHKNECQSNVTLQNIQDLLQHPRHALGLSQTLVEHAATQKPCIRQRMTVLQLEVVPSNRPVVLGATWSLAAGVFGGFFKPKSFLAGQDSAKF